MKPHPRPPRIRKTIKWGKYGGAAVTVLLVVVWIGSGWRGIGWRALNRDWITISSGNFKAWHWWPSKVVHTERQPGPYFSTALAGVGWRNPWTFRWESDDWHCLVEVPLWTPTVCAALVTTIAWRLDTLARRRAKGGLNLCPKCGYDRTGLVGGKDGGGAKCPECGSVAP